MPRPRILSKEYNLECSFCGEKFTAVKPEHLPAPKFCTHDCYSKSKRGQFYIKNGYKLVYKDGHPRADNRGRVRQHLLVMEEKIGRPVEKHESVHHIDGDKLNNHPDNLMLFASHEEHLRHHWEEESLRKRNGKRVRN